MEVRVTETAGPKAELIQVLGDSGICACSLWRSFVVVLLFCFGCLFFETGISYVALAVLVLAL